MLMIDGAAADGDGSSCCCTLMILGWCRLLLMLMVLKLKQAYRLIMEMNKAELLNDELLPVITKLSHVMLPLMMLECCARHPSKDTEYRCFFS